VRGEPLLPFEIKGVIDICGAVMRVPAKARCQPRDMYGGPDPRYPMLYTGPYGDTGLGIRTR
jgi:hypothetical protein